MSNKCEPGCQCGRHKRKPLTEEQRARMREAQKNAKGKKCPEGCTCARHKGYYFGGGKKGMVISEEGRANIAAAARTRGREYSAAERQKYSEQMKVQRADPEFEARRLAGLREVLTGRTCPEGCPCDKHLPETGEAIAASKRGIPLTSEHKAKIGAGSRAMWARKTPEERSEIAWQRIKKYGVSRVSKTEYVLAPFLAALGYLHNDDRALVVGRKFPDFYNEENHRLFEYFGNYWHPRFEEAEETIDYYRLQGWECTVLWESDARAWIQEHHELLNEEQFSGVWSIATRLIVP